MGALVGTYLEDRSKLIFEFYSPDYDGGVTYRILDFWENIKIKESQKPNLITYNPISRAGSLYSYGGAKSRAFSLSFNITLPNLANVSNLRKLGGGWGKYDRKQFFQERVFGKNLSWGGWGEMPKKYDSEFLALLENFDPLSVRRFYKNQNVARLDEPVLDEDGDITDEFTSSYTVTDNSDRNKAITTVMMWVGLIRASVMNDAKNPLNGPPIVRLRHGIMYQDVPCVCTGYNVSFDERGGYDVQTLLPRIINVTMNLEEYRNSGNYEHDTPILRDNNTGWESILGPPHTTDPGTTAAPTTIGNTYYYTELGSTTFVEYEDIPDYLLP